MTFDPLAEFFDGLNTTATGQRERNRPCEGRGIYALDSFGPKKTDKGYIITASLRVIRPAPGSTRKPGEEVEIAWFTYKGKTEGGENEKARARDFVNALLSRPNMTPAKEESTKFAGPTQPGRGLLVEIEAKTNTYTRKDKTTGTGTNYTFIPVPGQSNETVVKVRAQVEAWAGAEAAANPAPAPEPVAPVVPVAPAAAPAAAPGSPLAFLFGQ